MKKVLSPNFRRPNLLIKVRLHHLFGSHIFRIMQSLPRSQLLLDQVYNAVRGQRFTDIVVIKTKFDADPRHIILANAFSQRHLESGTEQINKQYKNEIKSTEEKFARLSISRDWNVVDFKSVVVHLFSAKCRKHFDIEQLWVVGPEYDDLTNINKISEPMESQHQN